MRVGLRFFYGSNSRIRVESIDGNLPNEWRSCKELHATKEETDIRVTESV